MMTETTPPKSPSHKRDDSAWQYLLARESKLAAIYPSCSFFNAAKPATQNQLICIPPSWDIVKKYAGAIDNKAAGFDADFYKHGELNYRGNHGEAAFHAEMQKTQLCGLLIGNIDSRHMLRAQQLGERHKLSYNYILPDKLANVAMEVLSEKVSATHDERFFELDFVFLHPRIGIYQFEVKTTANYKGTSVQYLYHKGSVQLENGILHSLFRKFCALTFPGENAEKLWEKYYAGGEVIFAPPDNIFGKKNQDWEATSSAILSEHPEIQNEAIKFLDHVQLEERLRRKSRTGNFFNEEPFKYFAVFLAGFRPDFFISPVLCALKTFDNIVTHEINAVRYYQASGDTTALAVFDSIALKHCSSSVQCFERLLAAIKPQLENKIVHLFHQMIRKSIDELKQKNKNLKIEKILHDLLQEDSMRPEITASLLNELNESIQNLIPQNAIADLLEPMKSDLISRFNSQPQQNIAVSVRNYLFDLKVQGLIRHCDIVFPNGRTDIALTHEQIRAIAVFTADGEFCNKKQILTGPPGSGKSLILMIKLFILKQIRHEYKLACASWYKHVNVIKRFARLNECPCCRTVEFYSQHGILNRMFGKKKPSVSFNDANHFEKIQDNWFNQTSAMLSVLKNPRYDCLLDERHPQNDLTRFIDGESTFADVFSIAVMTGGYKMATGDGTFWERLVPRTELSTVFRATNRIQQYVSSLLDREWTSGHSFDGVPVEKYAFDTDTEAYQAATQRIYQLNDIMVEAESTRDIAVVTEHPHQFSSLLAYSSCLPHNEKTQRANDVPSLEFPVVLAICSEASAKNFLPITASRAICHLITFQYKNRT